MSYLLGFDVGTTGVKAILISADGKVLSNRTRPYPLSSPRPRWVEQSPEDWWKGTKLVIQDVISEAGINAGEIKGISLSGQMHSSVFLDSKMQVIRPAILWSDTRTSRQCQHIYNRVGGLDKLIEYVSNPALEGFTAPKILWLRENEPENYKKTRYVLLPKDYIRYKLTGEVFTEDSDAAGTLLFDVKERKWSLDLLRELEIDPDILPPVLSSTQIAGRITKQVARETNLKENTPVVAGGADNACGAIGSGIIKTGRIMTSVGSSGVVLAYTDNPRADRQGRIHLFNHARPQSWYIMGVMLSAAMCLKWLKENICNNSLDYDRLSELAAGILPGSERLLFLPYLYGERTPHANSNARGVFFGISGKHALAHFARSVMEGVGFGLRDSLELIKQQGVKVKEVRAIGGGAKSRCWVQILADVLGEEISLLDIEEGPAFGATLIAGVGVNVYEDFEQAEDNIIRVKERISPESANTRLYNEFYQMYKRLYVSLKCDFDELGELTI